MPSNPSYKGLSDQQRKLLEYIDSFFGASQSTADLANAFKRANTLETYQNSVASSKENRRTYEKSFVSDVQPMVVTNGRTFQPAQNSDDDANNWAYGRVADIDTAIKTPGYIIEDIIRHELLTERDIELGTVTANPTTYTVAISGQAVFVDDYYNDAYLVISTDGYYYKILDYDATASTVEIDKVGDPTAADSAYIFNINPSIDTDSFDYSDDESTGLRKDWILTGSLIGVNSSENIIEKICYESFIYLLKSQDGYQIKIPDASNVVGTLQYHIYRNGRPNVSVDLTPLDEIYTDFTLNYNYCHARGTYLRQLKLNKDFSGHTDLDSYSDTCYDAMKNYRIRKKWEYSADWIKDEDTAVLFLEQVILRLTSQHLIMTFEGDFENHLKYEIGDAVLVYFPNVLPDSKDYQAVFMIYSKKINIDSHTVEFGLIELPEQPTSVTLQTESSVDIQTENDNNLLVEW